MFLSSCLLWLQCAVTRFLGVGVGGGGALGGGGGVGVMGGGVAQQLFCIINT